MTTRWPVVAAGAALLLVLGWLVFRPAGTPEEPPTPPTVPEETTPDAELPPTEAPEGDVAAVPSADLDRALRGVHIVRGDRVLRSENASQLFGPASVTKLVVTAAALHHLGPDHRLTTRLRGPEPRDGVVNGDLVVDAAGDPTWAKRFFPDGPRAPLRRLAEGLADRGARRVTGDLVVDLSSFPGRPEPTSRGLGELAYGYAAATSGLAVDQNGLAITMAPGRSVGDRARFEVPAGYQLDNRTVTVGREREGRGTLDFLPVWGRKQLVVRGEYPVSEPSYPMTLAAPDPEQRAAEALVEALRKAGVEIGGTIRLSTAAVPGGTVLASVESPPLRDVLPPILEKSDNWQAEMLLRRLALEVAEDGRSETGLRVEREFLEDVVGLPADAFSLEDASGLSPHDLLTPEAVVTLLRWVLRQPWRDVYLDALASNGQGTLAGWPKLPPLRGKTGTTRHALALAGVMTRGGGAEPVVFAVTVNHFPGENAKVRSWIAEVLGSVGA